MKRIALALAFASLIPAAHAVEYTQVQVDKSAVNFVYKQMGGKQWFNTMAFPTARFVSGSVKALGGNRYEVAGQLTIKGKTQDVVVPATFTAQGNAGVFDGSFTIRRADFTIGEGAWAKFDIVANDVQIKFRITAASK